MIRIMEKYHWDYWTFKSQPPHIISNILTMSSVESEYLEKNKNG